MKIPLLLGVLLLGVVSSVVAAPEEPTVIRNLAYVANGHARQKLDLFVPPNAPPAAPLLVWIHGGAWSAGSKENSPAVGMVQKGWVVASLNYRLSQHAVFPAQLEDCKAALRFLRAHAKEYHIDPARVAVWGASAGGHLVALLGVTGQTKEFDVVAKLFGGPVSKHLELAKKGSPITWVSKDSAPTLIMHGDKDPLVPLQQSESFAAALEKAGVPTVLKVYPGQGHGGPRFNDDAARKLMVEFVEKYTGATKAAAAN